MSKIKGEIGGSLQTHSIGNLFRDNWPAGRWERTCALWTWKNEVRCRSKLSGLVGQLMLSACVKCTVEKKYKCCLLFFKKSLEKPFGCRINVSPILVCKRNAPSLEFYSQPKSFLHPCWATLSECLINKDNSLFNCDNFWVLIFFFLITEAFRLSS